MPYIDGKRVSNEEWTAKYGSVQRLHTGPNGDNPAGEPEIDEDLGTVKVKKVAKKQAGGNRSAKSAKATKAAIADALGVKDDSATLDDIDVSGLDAPAADTEVAGPAADSTESV